MVGRLLITDGEENWLDTRRVERRLIVKIDLSLSSDSSLISLSLATNSLHLRPRRGRILFTSKLDIAPLASLLSGLSVPSNSRTCMQLQYIEQYLSSSSSQDYNKHQNYFSRRLVNIYLVNCLHFNNLTILPPAELQTERIARQTGN